MDALMGRIATCQHLHWRYQGLHLTGRHIVNKFCEDCGLQWQPKLVREDQEFNPETKPYHFNARCEKEL